jgi:hypothetical protein
MKEQRIPALNATGFITNQILQRIAEMDHITNLSLGGSRQLTDDGLHHPAAVSQLEHLDPSEYPGVNLTHRALEVLRHLPNLRTFPRPGITDAGLAHLANLPKLREIHLSGLPNVTSAGTGVFPARVHLECNLSRRQPEPRTSPQRKQASPLSKGNR